MLNLESKQVIVLRTKYPKEDGSTFKPRTGKLISQACHASMGVFFDRKAPLLAKLKLLVIPLNIPMLSWVNGSFTKVVVGIESEEELLKIYQQAKDANIPCCLITDSGRTEFHGKPTHTCIALGPDYAEKIDPITGHLKLL